MALISCIECHNQISDQATACPKCGCPVTNMKRERPAKTAPTRSALVLGKFLIVFFTLMSVAMIFVAISNYNNPAAIFALGLGLVSGYVVLDAFFDLTKRVSSFGTQLSGFMANYGSLLIPVVVVVGLMLYSWLPKTNGTDALLDEAGQNPAAAVSSEYEAEALTVCDAAVLRQIKNPSTFKTAWTWDTIASGYYIVLRRNFTAMNGFGATIDHFYKCRYDTQDKKIASLEVNEGNWQ